MNPFYRMLWRSPIGGVVERVLRLLCRVMGGHALYEQWHSGIETADRRELVLTRCRRCHFGQWSMVSRASTSRAQPDREVILEIIDA